MKKIAAIFMVLLSIGVAGCANSRTVTVTSDATSKTEFIGDSFKHLAPASGTGEIDLPGESRAGAYHIQFYGYPGIVGESAMGLKAYVYSKANAVPPTADPAPYFQNLVATGSASNKSWGEVVVKTPLDSAMQLTIWNPSTTGAVNAQYIVSWVRS